MSGLTVIEIAGRAMSLSELMALRAIAARDGEVAMRPLMRELGSTSSFAVLKVDRLIDLGLVAEVGRRTQGASRRLRATAQGRAALAEAAAFFASAAERRP